MKTILIDSFINLIYPNLCLHCHSKLTANLKILCKSCFSDIFFSQPKEHCKRCYTPIDNPHIRCPTCLKTPSPFNQQWCTFDFSLPLYSLYTHSQQLPTAYLNEALASLMAYYILKQNLRPDYLIPLPLSWFEEYQKGFCPALHLTQTLSHILSIPMLKTLKKSHDTYTLKTNTLEKLEDKAILLISPFPHPHPDVLTAGNALFEAYPKKLLCLSIYSEL